ncbi:hypothetical protein PENTCL1PPCAC_13385, partial [Pristionchus entomophagus]
SSETIVSEKKRRLSRSVVRPAKYNDYVGYSDKKSKGSETKNEKIFVIEFDDSLADLIGNEEEKGEIIDQTAKNENGSSESVVSEKRRRPSRSVVRPPKYNDYVGYSDKKTKGSVKTSENIFGSESHDSIIDNLIEEEEKKEETIDPQNTALPISDEREREITVLSLSAEEIKRLSHMKEQCFSLFMKEAGLDTIALCPSKTEKIRLSQLKKECFSVAIEKEKSNGNATPKCVLCVCDGSEFTIRQTEEKVHSTPQCVMCEVHPTTVCAYVDHLRKCHKSKLIMNGIYLLC